MPARRSPQLVQFHSPYFVVAAGAAAMAVSRSIPNEKIRRRMSAANMKSAASASEIHECAHRDCDAVIFYTKTNPRLLIINHITKNEPNNEPNLSLRI